jgi:hypothetical protein
MDPTKLPKHFDQIIYWSSWTISLSVTASNGFLQLFSLDKNYFEYALTTEQLKTEGWQFFQLSGKYEDDESHKEAYKDFSKSIENIKRKQVEKEYLGKGDVNKKKKEKPFDFQAELMKNLPEHLRPPQSVSQKKTDVEGGLPELTEVPGEMAKLDSLMNDKMTKLDSLMGLLEKKAQTGSDTASNVRDILQGSIKEQVVEAAADSVQESLDSLKGATNP